MACGAATGGDGVAMVYCYSNLDGGPVWERQYPMGAAPATIEVAGVTLQRDLKAEHSGQRSGDAWTEHFSQAMGARTPGHAKEIAARCRAAKVPVKFQFDTHGPIEVTSRRHQKQLMEVAHADQGRMVNWDDV